uniref:Retrotransposon protein n=2 Tax=Cucumis melo TaxID=3656 RepID=A0A9I9E5L9_CUCME
MSVPATTVIDCRIKTLKRTFQAIAEMWEPACSGFWWNDEQKCIIAKKELFDNWVRSHPAAKGLLNKSFPYNDKLTYVFSRHRAMGRFTETFTDVGSNEPGEYDEFDMANGNEVFPPVYNQGIDLSQDDVRVSRPSRDSEGKTESSGSKRKRGKFFRILREMSKLTSLDKGLLQRHLLSRMDDLWGFVLMLEDERDGFCRVLLRDIMR